MSKGFVIAGQEPAPADVPEEVIAPAEGAIAQPPAEAPPVETPEEPVAAEPLAEAADDDPWNTPLPEDPVERARVWQSRADKERAARNKYQKALGGMDPEAVLDFRKRLDDPVAIEYLRRSYAGQLGGNGSGEGQTPPAPSPAPSQTNGSVAQPSQAGRPVAHIERITLSDDDVYDEVTRTIAERHNQMADVLERTLSWVEQKRAQEEAHEQQRQVLTQVASQYMALGATREEAIAIAQELTGDPSLAQTYMKHVLQLHRHRKAPPPVAPTPQQPAVDPRRLEAARRKDNLPPPSGSGAAGGETAPDVPKGFVLRQIG